MSEPKRAARSAETARAAAPPGENGQLEESGLPKESSPPEESAPPRRSGPPEETAPPRRSGPPVESAPARRSSLPPKESGLPKESSPPEESAPAGRAPAEAAGSAQATQGVFAFVARLIAFGRDFRAFCSREADGMGVTLHEIDVLMALDDLPGMATVTAISAQSHISKGTISQAVESLRQKGLVAVAGDPNDRRRLQVCLTAAARPILERLYDAVRECLTLSFSDLPATQWSRLRTLFHGLRDLPQSLDPLEPKG